MSPLLPIGPRDFFEMVMIILRKRPPPYVFFSYFLFDVEEVDNLQTMLILGASGMAWVILTHMWRHSRKKDPMGPSRPSPPPLYPPPLLSLLWFFFFFWDVASSCSPGWWRQSVIFPVTVQGFQHESQPPTPSPAFSLPSGLRPSCCLETFDSFLLSFPLGAENKSVCSHLDAAERLWGPCHLFLVNSLKTQGSISLRQLVSQANPGYLL